MTVSVNFKSHKKTTIPELVSERRVGEQESHVRDHGGDGEVRVPLLLKRGEHGVRRVGRPIVGVRHVTEFVHPVIRHWNET